MMMASTLFRSTSISIGTGAAFAGARKTQGEIMRPWFLLLVLLPMVGLHNALAQSLQVQPIYGFSWPTHSIPINVEASTPNATGALSKAIRTWNLAQQWFINNYMAGVGKPFVFYETNSTFDSVVTVAFNQTQTTDDLGVTDWHALHDKQGNFQKVAVNISIDLTRNDGQVLSDDELQTLATHELGHALGLDHTTFSTTDLMNHVPNAMFPSTLNLYAVYLLSQSANGRDLPQQPVSLPYNIPYMTPSETDLDRMVAPVIETTTTSLGMSQIAQELTYGPWLWLGILVALASVVVALTIRGRKRGLTKFESGETQVIFGEEAVVEDKPIQPKNVKKCRYCGADVRRENLICPKCGMPTYT